MEFWALVAFGSESDRQSSAVGEQYELGHPQQCEALDNTSNRSSVSSRRNGAQYRCEE